MKLIDFVTSAFNYNTSMASYRREVPYIYLASTLLKNASGSAIIDVPAYMYSCLSRSTILKAVREDRIIRIGLPVLDDNYVWEGSSLSSALARCWGCNVRKCIKGDEVFYAGAGAIFDADFNPLMIPFVRLEVTMLSDADDFDIPISAHPGLWVSPTIMAATSGVYKSVKNNIVIPSCNTRIWIQTVDDLRSTNDLLKVESSDNTILCYKPVQLGSLRSPSGIMGSVINAAINSL